MPCPLLSRGQNADGRALEQKDQRQHSPDFLSFPHLMPDAVLCSSYSVKYVGCCCPVCRGSPYCCCVLLYHMRVLRSKEYCGTAGVDDGGFSECSCISSSSGRACFVAGRGVCSYQDAEDKARALRSFTMYFTCHQRVLKIVISGGVPR